MFTVTITNPSPWTLLIQFMICNMLLDSNKRLLPDSGIISTLDYLNLLVLKIFRKSLKRPNLKSFLDIPGFAEEEKKKTENGIPLGLTLVLEYRVMHKFMFSYSNMLTSTQVVWLVAD